MDLKSPEKIGSALEKVCNVIWALAMICLPITTFPLFSSITDAIVAPLSILPFFLLLLIWTIPLIIRKGVLPRESIPLAVFTLVAILACAGAYFMFIPGFKGKSIPGQELRALFTLAIGLIFYLVSATWVNTVVKFRDTWKYITIGGVLSLFWTAFQAYYVLQHADQYPAWLERIQSWFVVQSPSFTVKFGRVNGFTYEASWFAHQMVLIYLPLWLAATYHRTSAFKFRILRITVENILLVIGLAAFFLSSPRIALVSLFLVLVFMFIKTNLVLHRKAVDFISQRQSIFQHLSGQHRKAAIHTITSLLLIFIYILFLSGAFYLLLQRDYRLETLIYNPPTPAEIVGLLTLDQNVLIGLSSRFIFLERVIYWLNGWNVFSYHPWLGVGLGNAGFFFPDLAPAIGWATFEIRTVLYYMIQLPNIKSLWFRLLAETGLVGFSVFISWLVLLYRSAKHSQLHQDPTVKTLALAGQLAILAFIGEGFSIDSFAMPYFWVAAGLIAATGMLVRNQWHHQGSDT